jgi:hypothetical protein
MRSISLPILLGEYKFFSLKIGSLSPLLFSNIKKVALLLDRNGKNLRGQSLFFKPFLTLLSTESFATVDY